MKTNCKNCTSKKPRYRWVELHRQNPNDDYYQCMECGIDKKIKEHDELLYEVDSSPCIEGGGVDWDTIEPVRTHFKQALLDIQKETARRMMKCDVEQAYKDITGEDYE